MENQTGEIREDSGAKWREKRGEKRGDKRRGRERRSEERRGRKE